MPPHSGYADRRDRTVLAALVGLFAVYAALFIYRTSFVIEGERYFSLFDDGMVSMRYASNLAHGYGLVWNPGGERVEGYTNPLWVAYMALVHVLPIAASKTSLVVQLTAAALLALNLVYVWRLALGAAGGSRPVASGAVLLTASYLPLNNWSLQGMEVSVLVLLTTICSSLAIRCIDSGTFSRTLWLLLGASLLFRIDMAAPFAAFAAFLMVFDPRNRRRHMQWSVSLLLGVMAALTIFRVAYYGDLLPNTYYLKMTGVPASVRIGRGAYVLVQFVWRANPLLFLIAGAAALRRDPRLWLLSWILVAQMAYSAYVGGDAWEYWGGANRFICIAMPGFFVLLSYALYHMAAALARAAPASLTASRVRVAAAMLFAALLVYAAVRMNSIYGRAALAEALLIRPPLHTGPGGENQLDVEVALLLRHVTSADATIAVMRAGTIPYFADRYSIDMLGKNDRHVARVDPASAQAGRASKPLAISFREFRPGHMKTDFAYSIAGRKPDVVLQLRRRTDLAKPYLQPYQNVLVDGSCVLARRESPRVFWDRLPPHGCDAN